MLTIVSDSPEWSVLSQVYRITDRSAKRWGHAWLSQSRWASSCRHELLLWQLVRDWSLLDIFRAMSIAKSVWSTHGVSGQIVEFGVAQGGTAAFLAMLSTDSVGCRHVVGIDSFMGLPDPIEHIDRGYRAGSFATDKAAVAQRLTDLGVASDVTLVQSAFDACDAALPAELSLVHADGDLYESTKAVLAAVKGRVPPGGMVLFDDAWDQSGGVWKAVEECLEPNGTCHLGPTGQLVWTVGPDAASPATDRLASTRNGVPVSTAWVEDLAGYVDFLGECRRRAFGVERRALDDFGDLVGLRFQ